MNRRLQRSPGVRVIQYMASPAAPDPASSHSPRLYDLGRRVILAHAEQLPGVACGVVSGSTAEGVADDLSDLDLILYYDLLPPADALAGVRAGLGGADEVALGGAFEDGAVVVQFKLEGVDVQVVHTTVRRWQAEIEAGLAGQDPGGPQHKAMYGTLASTAVVGGERLAAWQRQIAAYSDALRTEMVAHHLRFFPLWKHVARLGRRDADLWCRQALVEGSFNVLGTLAGVNRRYFTSFQFKRARAFQASLPVRPPELIDRLEGLWRLDIPAAAEALRGLARETVEIVEREMPEFDTSAARRAIG